MVFGAVRVSVDLALLLATGGAQQVAVEQLGAPGGAQFLVPPPCGTNLATANFAGAIGPIADNATQQFTCVVSGAASYLWDVDLLVAITHTWNADLDIELTSPAGTVVIVSTDNGGSNDDVFNGTRFDDSATLSVAGAVYFNSVAQPLLSPESHFSRFRGENPNGVWTLTITDDAWQDVGNLNAFALDVSTITPAPVSAYTYAGNPNLTIPDNTTIVASLLVSGAGTLLEEVELRTFIAHTFNADLEIELRSPSGTTVTVSSGNGGSFDDVFNGTWWDDDAVTPVTDYPFVNGVAAQRLSPEAWFGWFMGEDPNGVWQLLVTDNYVLDTGLLSKWELVIITCGCSTNPLNYCTSSTTTHLCNPALSASAPQASISAGPGSFVLTCSAVEGQKPGLIFYGTSSAWGAPWGAGSTSYLCVAPPIQRGPVQSSAGAANACNGSLTLDFFAFMAANPLALGQPLAQGQRYFAQAWFRDPPAVKTTNLSDALFFTTCP